MKASIAVLRKVVLAYNAACKPLCKELDLPQTAFDILMFLGNNPECKTASEIVEIRRIKANLVSINVDRLVRDEYLVRCAINGDRRKTQLICTEKANKVIERGQKLQNDFTDRVFANMTDDVRNAFSSAMSIIEENLNEMLMEE